MKSLSGEKLWKFLHDPEIEYRYKRAITRKRETLDSGREIVQGEHFITHVHRGTLRVEIGEERFMADKGHLLWIMPGTRRRLENSGRGTCLHTNLRFNILKQKTPLRLKEDFMFLDHSLIAEPLIHNIIDLLRENHGKEALRLRAIIQLLLGEFIGKISDRQQGLDPLQRRRIDEYILDHLQESISPKDLAHALHYTPDYFSRIFRATYHQSPKSYIIKEKMQAAALQLVDSDEPVQNIARSVGYEHMSLFGKSFRALHGSSPREYRKLRTPIERNPHKSKRNSRI